LRRRGPSVNVAKSSALRYATDDERYTTRAVLLGPEGAPALRAGCNRVDSRYGLCGIVSGKRKAGRKATDNDVHAKLEVVALHSKLVDRRIHDASMTCVTMMYATGNEGGRTHYE
jgi:hypothetical protein